MMIEPGSSSVEDLLLVGHDPLAELGAGDQPGLRAGGDDQVVAGDGAGVAVLVLHLDGLLAVLDAEQGAPAVDLGDLVLLHQEVDALDDARGDLAAALVRRAVGHRGVALDAELVLLVREHVGELGVAEQRLGGDAADVEADTAPVLLLDDGRGLAELRRADRRHVTTGAGTKNENVEVGHARPAYELVALATNAGTNLQTRDALRRLRDQPRSGPHGRALPALPDADHRLAHRLAAHLRRRGARLGRRPGDDRRGPDRPGLRRGLRRHPRGRAATSTAGSRPTPGSTARPRCGSRR